MELYSHLTRAMGDANKVDETMDGLNKPQYTGGLLDNNNPQRPAFKHMETQISADIDYNKMQQCNDTILSNVSNLLSLQR